MPVKLYSSAWKILKKQAENEENKPDNGEPISDSKPCSSPRKIKIQPPNGKKAF